MMSALIHASSAIPYQITGIILKNMNVKEIPASTTTVFPPLIKFVYTLYISKPRTKKTLKKFVSHNFLLA